MQIQLNNLINIYSAMKECFYTKYQNKEFILQYKCIVVKHSLNLEYIFGREHRFRLFMTFQEIIVLFQKENIKYSLKGHHVAFSIKDPATTSRRKGLQTRYIHLVFAATDCFCSFIL